MPRNIQSATEPLTGKATDETHRAVEALWLMPSFMRASDALCKRDGKLRSRVWRVLDRLAAGDLTLHRSPIAGARREIYHTRVDGEKRLIDEPLTGTHAREIAALYVGHHEDANSWGAEYADDTPAKLRSARAHQPSAPKVERRVAEAAPAPYSRRASSKRYSSRSGSNVYGAVLTPRELEARGVPPELIETVLATADCVDLESVGVPADVAVRVENWYLSKLPPARVRIAVPADGDPAPIRVTREELPTLLRLPLHRFLASMTDDQRRLANRPSERLLIVRGAAGSGKTIVGIRRIERWVQQRDLFDDRPILFTCYNRVLAGAARQMVEDTLGTTLEEARVEVRTAYQLMASLQRELEGRSFADLVPTKKLLPAIKAARAAAANPIIDRWSDEEILDEVLELIYGRVIRTEAEYLEADRSGRGSEKRLNTAARSAVWRVYQVARDEWKRKGIAPWDQLPARVVGLLERNPVERGRYAAVVVDEVQDLPPSFLRALLLLQGGSDNNMLILGDAAQNVYRNGFRWKHTGLTAVGGQFATLRRCFRSTASVVGAAQPLVSQQAARFEDDLTLPEAGSEEGPPVEVTLYDSHKDELEGIAMAIASRIEDGVPPSAIGVLLDDYAARRALIEHLRTLDCDVEDFLKQKGEKSLDIFHPSVKLLTTGSAKGIEFQVLFIPRVTAAAFPATDEDGESADRARRVLYTAMTRCAWELHLSAPRGEESALLGELGQAFVRRPDVHA